MKKYIPNLITLANLFCGTIAILFAIQGDFYTTAILVIAGIIFDFFDGFVARLLNVQGELGKQLDSLADMVTSGVVPGIVMLKLIEKVSETNSYLPYVGLLLALGAGYRLAKFNIDTRQTTSFIGLPTPAMNLFIISLPLIVEFYDYQFLTNLIQNKIFLIVVTILFTYLMNAELPLFSLKFKDYSFKKNVIKYVFLMISVVLIITLKIVSLPIIILLYVLFSVVDNLTKSKKESL